MFVRFFILVWNCFCSSFRPEGVGYFDFFVVVGPVLCLVSCNVLLFLGVCCYQSWLGLDST